ncbi:hypothetical protein PsYK624_126710 [Phanerochaete sordida]|uniref:Uncharacterized protein n=1 Tax=Phanerochaete sordida TaxID=48140 RepID=A0A9P3LJA2_9APHY|nr:hypothetical protein PsYK624_126710 [Phanerochaete sordida]
MTSDTAETTGRGLSTPRTAQRTHIALLLSVPASGLATPLSAGCCLSHNIHVALAKDCLPILDLVSPNARAYPFDEGCTDDVRSFSDIAAGPDCWDAKSPIGFAGFV